MCNYLFYRTNFFRGRNEENCLFIKKILTETYFAQSLIENVGQPFRPDSSEKWCYNNKNTVFNLYCVASRHSIFSFLFFPRLDHKWSRDTDISFRTLQENWGYRFSEVVKFWKFLNNFHKNMTIIRFYAN